MALRLTILAVLLALTTLLQSCASGSSSSGKVSWSDSEMTFEISASGKSKKDVVDAVDVWGAKTFGSWQKVIQAKLQDRGIIVFRYRESMCDKMVSVEIKPKNNEIYLVDFLNVRGGECYVRKKYVEVLKTNFKNMAINIELAIAEF